MPSYEHARISRMDVIYRIFQVKNNLTVKKNVLLVVKELLFCVIGDYTYYGYLFVFNTFEIVFALFFDLVIVCSTKEDDDGLYFKLVFSKC